MTSAFDSDWPGTTGLSPPCCESLLMKWMPRRIQFLSNPQDHGSTRTTGIPKSASTNLSFDILGWYGSYVSQIGPFDLRSISHPARPRYDKNAFCYTNRRIPHCRVRRSPAKCSQTNTKVPAQRSRGNTGQLLRRRRRGQGRLRPRAHIILLQRSRLDHQRGRSDAWRGRSSWRGCLQVLTMPDF